MPRVAYGFGLGTGDLNSDGATDVIGTTFYNSDVLAGDGALGPIAPSHTTDAGYAVEQVKSSENLGFGTSGVAVGDLDGDGATDMAISAPDSSSGSSCTKAGTVYVWRGSGQAASAWHAPLRIQAPERDVDTAHFGWRVLIANVGSLRFLIIGERGRDLGGVSGAGQIYLYRVSTP